MNAEAVCIKRDNTVRLHHSTYNRQTETDKSEQAVRRQRNQIQGDEPCRSSHLVNGTGELQLVNQLALRSLVQNKPEQVTLATRVNDIIADIKKVVLHKVLSSEHKLARYWVLLPFC